MEIIKLGILYFSLFTWYQSQERKPNFLGDRVSFRSPSPPPDLLLTTAAAAVTAAGDFSGSSSPAGNHRFRGARGRSTYRWQPRRQPDSHAPSRADFLRQLAVHAPARECACGRVSSSPATGLHTQGRPAPSWSSIPPAVQPEPSLSTFWPFLSPPWSSVPLQSPTAVSHQQQQQQKHFYFN